MTEASDRARILGSLGQRERLRVVAALVLGAASAEEVSARTGLPGKRTLQELSRLSATGLLEETVPGRYRLRIEELMAAARLAAKSAETGAAGPPATPEEKVRRTFLKDGKLLAIPVVRS